MESVSLWKLLKRGEIQIPLYQRDYAQGGEDKEPIRKNFVSDMFKALQSDEDKLRLDFIFGVRNESGVYQPLDGQQRLTTLWLLHWYVAQRAEVKPENEDWKILRKFSYETRETSKRFCCDLAAALDDCDWEKVGCLDAVIRKRKWYFDRYDLDPSVRGFLNTLRTIHACARKAGPTYDYSQMWERLKKDECCISFFLKDDIQENVAEDLYITMNSRGKKLMSFENFKADIIGQKDEDGNAIFTDVATKSIDNEWTDLFWPHRNKYGEIDDIYFQFLKRYLLAYSVAVKDKDKNVDEIVKPEHKDNLFWHLHRDGGRYVAGSIEYYKPAIELEMVKNLSSFFNAYKKCIDLFGSDTDLDEIVAPYWDRKTKAYTLIPRYPDDGEKGAKGLKKDDLDRVMSGRLYEGLPVFYSACRFLEAHQDYLNNQNDCNKDAFRKCFERWMRFVWNVTDGSFASTSDVLVALIRLFHRIADGLTEGAVKGELWNVDKYLVNNGNTLVDGPDKESAKAIALMGEIQKARLRDWVCSGRTGYSWNIKIAEAEEVGFLHGALEFLFPSEVVDKYIEGTLDLESNFEQQLKNMKQYFTIEKEVDLPDEELEADEERVFEQKREKTFVNDKYAVPLCKALIKCAGTWDEGVYCNPFLCRTDEEAWRQGILRNKNMARALAVALLADSLDEVGEVHFRPEDLDKESIRGDWLKSRILEWSGDDEDRTPAIVGPGLMHSWYLRKYDDKPISFYRKSGRGCRSDRHFFIDDKDCKMNRFLVLGKENQGRRVAVNPSDCVCGLCCAKEQNAVRFTYTTGGNAMYELSWSDDNLIRLLGAEGETDMDSSSRGMLSFKFMAAEIIDDKSFYDKLDELIREFKSGEPSTMIIDAAMK